MDIALYQIFVDVDELGCVLIDGSGFLEPKVVETGVERVHCALLLRIENGVGVLQVSQALEKEDLLLEVLMCVDDRWPCGQKSATSPSKGYSRVMGL